MTAGVATRSGTGPEGQPEVAFGGRTLLDELLVASGRRDEDAFGRFYQLTSPWIYALLRRRPVPGLSAEDALARAYRMIWHRSAGFTPRQRSALAWATAIAYEVAQR